MDRVAVGLGGWLWVFTGDGTTQKDESMTPSEMCAAQADFVPAGTCEDVPTISNNPKDIAARGKCPLWLVPPVAEHIEARVLELGARKYGAWNWRDQPIQLSTYLSAIKRHLAAYIDGETQDPESGLNHLAHVRATCGIILDAQMKGTLIDDRPGK